MYEDRPGELKERLVLSLKSITLTLADQVQPIAELTAKTRWKQGMGLSYNLLKAFGMTKFNSQ
jgi:hypothetical protein